MKKGGKDRQKKKRNEEPVNGKQFITSYTCEAVNLYKRGRAGHLAEEYITVRDEMRHGGLGKGQKEERRL